MSMSPKPSPAVSVPAAAGVSPGTQPFPYVSLPPGPASRNGCEGYADSGLCFWSTDTDQNEPAAREAQARAQGRAEGQEDARKIFQEHLARERASLAAALEQFTRDRATYFSKIEGEVVQLALAIARKILYREAQIDPLLLAGIVRVALEKIDGATGIRLRVNPENASDWRGYLSTRLEPDDLPEMVEDPSQALDCCALETSMGTATVGLEVQMKEIEQGLMDLLAARPRATS